MADIAAPTHTFDLVLLGGGTGGYVAAIRAKQLGLNVAVVEELILGGCCLHRGCIPTKAFLKSADMFDDVKRAAEFGVDVAGDISFNYDTALSRSKKIVEGQYKGLLYLFDKKHQIPVFLGRGKLLNKTTVGVTPNPPKGQQWARSTAADRPSRSAVKAFGSVRTRSTLSPTPGTPPVRPRAVLGTTENEPFG
jgi:pyruvate/2-oxoglutarate dehydrogenase complex dihydrolipoamide dehydrogenase (E3) component